MSEDNEGKKPIIHPKDDILDDSIDFVVVESDSEPTDVDSIQLEEHDVSVVVSEGMSFSVCHSLPSKLSLTLFL